MHGHRLSAEPGSDVEHLAAGGLARGKDWVV